MKRVCLYQAPRQMKKTFPLFSNFRLWEVLVLLFIWLGIFLIPYFNDRVYGAIVWETVLEEWVSMLGFLVIFLLNIYIFVPGFLFRKRYVSYILFTLVFSGIVVFLSLTLRETITTTTNSAMPPMEIGPGMPPMELSSQMPPPKGFKPAAEQVTQSIYIRFLDYMLIAILVVAASTSFKLFSRWLNEESKNEELEKERLKSELALLRNQVSPHFLMNTLNNIHALIVVDQARAKDAVIRLSTLMRYLLYDTSLGRTSLAKEVEFIESYFSLMKLRYTKDVDLKLTLPQDIQDIPIPPMLFISFLENAFKHGVSYQEPSFVYFQLEIDGSRINCFIRNSVHPNKTKSNDHYSGIGLANVKKSLELLYPKNYMLDIKDDGIEFIVSLSIPTDMPEIKPAS